MQNRKPVEFISALAALIAVLDILWLDVTWISVTLLGIAVAPWVFSFERIHQYVDKIELPGGTKVALRHASEEAEAIELEPSGKTSDVDAFLETIEENPNLTLAGIRIELERRLRLLANLMNIQKSNSHTSARRLQQSLLNVNGITKQEYSLLADLWPILNRAVHAQNIDAESQHWAISAARPLINNLDARIDKFGDGDSEQKESKPA